MEQASEGSVTLTVEAEGDNDYDKSHNSPSDKQAWKNRISLTIMIVFCLGWASVAIYAFISGNPGELLNPRNSDGEICGQGDQNGKPNLLYFDLTQCAGLQAEDACPTPQICVKECPESHWTSNQGIPSGLDQYCDNMTASQFEHTTITISRLVKQRKCLAYILPSKPVLGRCIPVYGLVMKAEAAKYEAKMNAMKTTDGEVLLAETLMEGVKYAMSSIDNLQKLLAYLSVKSPIVLLCLLLAMVLFLICTVLIKLACKPFLLTSIALCVIILISGTVLSVIRYSQLLADNKFLPTVITNMSSYRYNKITWLVCCYIFGVITLFTFMVIVLLYKKIIIAINLIEKASKCVSWSLLWIPIGQSIIQVSVIFVCMTVAIFLASSGSPEYRVVDACLHETCSNAATGNPFRRNDICDPSTFAECTGCDMARCVYHKFEHSVLGSWLQVWNICGLVWLLVFVHQIGCKIVDGSFSKQSSTMNKATDHSNVWVWSSFKTFCQHHLGALPWISLEPFLGCIKRGIMCLKMNRSSSMQGSEPRYNFGGPWGRSSDRLLGNVIIANSTLFRVKLLVSLLVAIAIAFLPIQVGSTPEIPMNYQICLLLIVLVGSYVITSGFFSVYILDETKQDCNLEDSEKNEGNEENPFELRNPMTQQ